MSISPDDFALFTQLLKKTSGFALTPAKTYLLEARLVPILEKYNCKTLGDLASLLRRSVNSALIYDITEAMTTNETLFFRDDRPFRHFRSVLLPALLKRREHKKSLRIWSAACSTGQEPYSVAITLNDMLQNQAGWTIDILATDISKSVLQKARLGTYSKFEIQRGLPIPMMVAHFAQQPGDQWQIHEKFRKMVRFEEFNLMSDMMGLGTFDMIFCRNVLIYFDEPTKKNVLENLSRRLAPDGYMMLGGAETALCSSDHLALADGCPGLYTPVCAEKPLARELPSVPALSMIDR